MTNLLNDTAVTHLSRNFRESFKPSEMVAQVKPEDTDL